jgi:hypothetical protein
MTIENEEKVEEKEEVKEEVAVPEVEDLSSLFASLNTPEEEPDVEPEKKEEKEPEAKPEDKEPVKAEEEEKKETPPAEEKKDTTDWEKRYKDTQQFLDLSATEKKALVGELHKSQAEVGHLTKTLETVHKEVFPDKDMPKVEVKDDPAVDPEADKWEAKVKEAEALTMSVYSDYKDIVGEKNDPEAPYMKAITEDPNLWNRVKVAVNPALEAYKIGKEYTFRHEYGSNAEEIKAKLKEETRKEILAELAEKDKPPEPKKRRVTTLRDADDKGVGGIPSEIESLSSIIGGR